MVDEIWAWDAVQNGDAGILNASSLPATRMYAFWLVLVQRLILSAFKLIGPTMQGTS